MATLTTTTVRAWAHCRDPRCPGVEQEPVDATRHLTEWSFVDNGGNLPGVERSTDLFVFADASQAPCPHCGLDREVSAQQRPNLPPLSGHRQDGLLYVKQFDAGKQPAGNDAIVAQLMAQVAELSARIASGNPDAQPPERRAASRQNTDTQPSVSLATPPKPSDEPREPETSDLATDEDAAEEELRKAAIYERRMAALTKARAAKAAKAKA